MMAFTKHEHFKNLNMRSDFPLRQHLLQDALAALANATGLRGHATGLTEGQGIADVILEITHGNIAAKFAAKINETDRHPALAQLKAREHALIHPPLLVAPYIARPTAEQCRELGLPFIDTAGNAYLEAQGLFVFIAGRPRKPGNAIEKHNYQALTPTGLRLVYGLLTEPDLLDANYRRLAKTADIAIGGVGRALKDLELRGHLTPEGTVPRRLLAATQLREEWVVHYPIRLRPKLRPRRFTHIGTNPMFGEWWKNADLRPYSAVWGGEVGANIITSHLRPETVTIYAHDAIEPLLTKFRLRPDPVGNIEILDAFWERPEGDTAITAPPLVLYADLMAAGNARCIETAKLVYEQFFA